MVEAIENSSVPVVIFISPTGSRAGSAGFFLPRSRRRCSHGSRNQRGRCSSHRRRPPDRSSSQAKIENDAAAFLRSYTASTRARNVEAAEDAIRNSKSYSDEEALRLKLIDLVSADDASLLTALDGREIHRFNGSTQTLHLQGATILTTAPSLRERLLSQLTNPDIAVLLLVIGGLLIYLEFNVPGTVVPGSLGTLFVLLSLFGLNLLPIRHTAIALLLIAVVMMVLEAK
jgi:membrane-bound serine protease (ClpP class)